MKLPGFLDNLRSNDPSRSFVRSHPGLILYLVITLLIMALYLEQNSLFQSVDNKIRDSMFAFRGEQEISQDVVFLEIDDKALDYLGWWPWSHQILAQMIEALDYYQPRTILLNFKIGNNVNDYVSGTSQLLAENILQSNNIVIPFEGTPGNRTPASHAAPEWLSASAIRPGVISRDEITLVSRLDLPEEIFGNAAHQLGVSLNLFEDDFSVRSQPLIAKYENHYYPSTELVLAADYLGVDLSQIRYVPGEKIQLGNRSIPVNRTGCMLINYMAKPGSFASYSIKELWEGKIPVDALQNKLVIVALTATGQYDMLKTPLGNFTPSEKSTTVIANIIQGKFINSLYNSGNLGIMIILGIGLFSAILVPRVALMHRFVVLVVFLFVLINLNFILFSSFNTISSTFYPGLEIILFMIAAPMMKSKADLKRLEDKKRERQINMQESLIENEITRAAEAPKTPRPVPQRKKVTEHEHTEQLPKSRMTDTDAETLELSAFDHSVVNVDDAVIDQGSGNEDSYEHEHRPAPEATPSRGTKPSGSPDSQHEESSGRIEISFDESGRPSKFGRYKILDVLGQGAMGTVYKGLDPAIGRPVALKTIRFDRLANADEIEELRRRFMLEAKAAGSFSHPNIVTIYDVGQDKNIQYIAMEYLEGRTLDQIIKKKQDWNFRIVANVIYQVCNALAYAHERHVIHRDIKPANIMILEGFRVKVMDFGIAHFESSNMTQTGVAMGTPNYISPEQLSGKEVTQSSDIFSLGVVMYEMLTGVRPFEGENLNNLIMKILNHSPQMPSKLDEKVPPLLDHVVMKALEKDPVKRFHSAREMGSALGDFVSSFKTSPARY